MCEAICLSLPPWKLFGGFLNVYSSFSTGKLPLGGLGYFFACTAILGILGAVNVFVTVIEKNYKNFVLLLFTHGLFAVFGFSRRSTLHATLLKSTNVKFC